MYFSVIRQGLVQTSCRRAYHVPNGPKPNFNELNLFALHWISAHKEFDLCTRPSTNSKTNIRVCRTSTKIHLKLFGKPVNSQNFELHRYSLVYNATGHYKESICHVETLVSNLRIYWIIEKYFTKKRLTFIHNRLFFCELWSKSWQYCCHYKILKKGLPYWQDSQSTIVQQMVVNLQLSEWENQMFILFHTFVFRGGKFIFFCYCQYFWSWPLLLKSSYI